MPRAAPWLAALVLAGGCGQSASEGASADSPVERALLRGVAQIRGTHDPRKLYPQLARTLAGLRSARPSTAAERRARALAIEGLVLTRRAVRSELDFIDKDSGEVAAATRDARQADRFFALGATRLRAAGAALGIRIGKIDR
jgi:hypothetical protein